MRVLHVISGLGTGGAESFLATILPRLRERGIDSTVASLTGVGPTAERIRAAGIPLLLLDVRGAWKAPQAIQRLAAAVRELNPGAIQGWMYHGDLAATIVHRLAAKRGTRLLWNIRCSDMRLEDYSTQLRFVVRACANLSRRPDVVIANSQAGAQAHVGAGYRPRRLVVIPNGIDCESFQPDPSARMTVRAELGIPRDRPVIIHVARVDPMKDHAGFMIAAEALRGSTIVLAGAGTEAFTRAPGIIGLGQRRDVPRLLAAADIVASSSAYGEGFSNAIAEGMAAGLVPVVTDVGDARMIVGEAGAVVPPSDPQALAHALQTAIDLEPSLRQQMASAARARIATHFAIERAVERFAALYLETA